MAEITVTIGNPILTAGQSFKVRYRALPAGVYSAPQTETNAPFTVTGLTANTQYQFEIIVVNADASECPPVYYIFTAYEFICPVFDVVQQGDGVNSPYQLLITYTLPMGYVAPCKWYVSVRDTAGGGSAATQFTTLPASPFTVNLPMPVRDFNVRIYADQCDGTFKYCFDEDIPKPVSAPCIPLVLGDHSVTSQGFSGGFRRLNVAINFTNSTPITSPITVYWQQVNAAWQPTPINIVPPYTAQQGQTIPIPVGSGTNITPGFLVAPTLDEKYYIKLWFTDICGKMHIINAFIQFT